MLSNLIKKVALSNAAYKLAASQPSSSSQQSETIGNEDFPIANSGVKSKKRGDIQFKIDVADIGIQSLNDYLCPSCSCIYGRNCCRRVSIGEISDARASFWGEKECRLSTTDRGRKIFNLLINAKAYDNNGNTIFQFALDSKDGINNTRTIICEGNSYRFFIM